MQPDSHCGVENGFRGQGLEAGKPLEGLLMHKLKQKPKEAWQKGAGRVKWIHSKDTQKLEAAEPGDRSHVE